MAVIYIPSEIYSFFTFIDVLFCSLSIFDFLIRSFRYIFICYIILPSHKDPTVSEDQGDGWTQAVYYYYYYLWKRKKTFLTSLYFSHHKKKWSLLLLAAVIHVCQHIDPLNTYSGCRKDGVCIQLLFGLFLLLLEINNLCGQQLLVAFNPSIRSLMSHRCKNVLFTKCI